jgi:hypothetical protein
MKRKIENEMRKKNTRFIPVNWKIREGSKQFLILTAGIIYVLVSFLSFQKIRERTQNFINRTPKFRDIVNHLEMLFIPKLNIFVNEMNAFLDEDEIRSLTPLIEKYGNERGIGIPLIINDDVIGVIAIFSEDLKHTDISSVKLFADQTVNVIEKSKLYLQISQLAITGTQRLGIITGEDWKNLVNMKLNDPFDFQEIFAR